MYVEVGENRPYLEKFPFSFVSSSNYNLMLLTCYSTFGWQKINEVGRVPFESTVRGNDPMKAAITALTGVENEHFPTIRDWIRHFLQDESEVRYIVNFTKQSINSNNNYY